MSIVFLDSFDNYLTGATAELGKWQTDNNGNLLTIVAGGGRNATAGLQFSMAGGLVNSPGVYRQRPFTTTTRLILGFAIKMNTFDPGGSVFPIQWLDSSTAQVSFFIRTDGKIGVSQGLTNSVTILSQSTNAAITATGVYYYVELDITFHATLGAITIRVNGVSVPGTAVTNVNTAPSGNNQVNVLRLGSVWNAGTVLATPAVYLFDDMYTIDPTVGAQNTSFLGDTRVFAAFPTSDGTPLNFTASPAGSHYLNVNQVEQDGDTTYNFDATAADIDVYGHTATPANTGTIFGVQLCQVSRKDSAAARSTANYLKSAASNTTGATQALSQSYAWYLDIVELDPATGVAFTKAGFDATQIGVKVAA